MSPAMRISIDGDDLSSQDGVVRTVDGPHASLADHPFDRVASPQTSSRGQHRVKASNPIAVPESAGWILPVLPRGAST